MAGEEAAAAAGGASSALTGLLGSAVSIWNNERNIQMQQQINAQNLAQAKELQQTAWERDDRAYQRAIEDATKAGLSPLAVLQAGTAGNTITPTAQATAPQSDLSEVINSLISASGILQRGQEIETQREKTKAEIEATKKQLELQERQLSQEFTIKNKELELQEKENITNIKQLNKAFELQTNQLNETIKTRNYQAQEQVSQQSTEEYKKFCDTYGVSPTIIRTSDFDEFMSLNEKANENFIKFKKELYKEIPKLYDAMSKAHTGQGGGGLGIGGLHIQGNGGGAESESYTMTTQTKAKIAELMEKYNVRFIIYTPKINDKTRYKYEQIDNPYEE